MPEDTPRHFTSAVGTPSYRDYVDRREREVEVSEELSQDEGEENE